MTNLCDIHEWAGEGDCPRCERDHIGYPGPAAAVEPAAPIVCNNCFAAGLLVCDCALAAQPPAPQAEPGNLSACNFCLDQARQALDAERERCAACADDFAAMMENGAGELEPGQRLRQLARKIRSGEAPLGTAKFYAAATMAAEPVAPAMVDLPNLPKAFRVETPRNSEPFGLFTVQQMIDYRLAGRAAEPVEGAEPAQPKLAVWFGSMPESNGKKNWTVMLHRADEGAWDGITIERSEYKDRARYEADRLRYLVGEIADEPDILDYDSELGAPASAQAGAVPVSDEQLAELWTSANENPYSVWRDRIRAAIAKAAPEESK